MDALTSDSVILKARYLACSQSLGSFDTFGHVLNTKIQRGKKENMTHMVGFWTWKIATL